MSLRGTRAPLFDLAGMTVLRHPGIFGMQIAVALIHWTGSFAAFAPRTLVLCRSTDERIAKEAYLQSRVYFLLTRIRSQLCASHRYLYLSIPVPVLIGLQEDNGVLQDTQVLFCPWLRRR